MFWNKGNWVDVEKHKATMEISILGVRVDDETGVVVFQQNDRTKKKRAVLKCDRVPEKIMDADIAEMKLGVTVNWG
jgi:hypothetical protein